MHTDVIDDREALAKRMKHLTRALYATANYASVMTEERRNRRGTMRLRPLVEADQGREFAVGADVGREFSSQDRKRLKADWDIGKVELAEVNHTINRRTGMDPELAELVLEMDLGVAYTGAWDADPSAGGEVDEVLRLALRRLSIGLADSSWGGRR